MFAIILPHNGSAAEPATIYLWTGDVPDALGTEEKDRPKLFVHRPTSGDQPEAQTAVVVCPGGGYGGLAMGHEGEQIAAWFNEMGITACILDYRHRGKGYGHPAPLLDVQRAIRTVRAHADDWNIATDKIGVMGFSAGGHLASSAGTHFDSGAPQAPAKVDRQSSRPDFMILCYPVIAFDQPYTHRGSQKNLLGSNAVPELVKSMSSEQQVTPETPPTFLFHTNEDQAVPPENSVQFYLALRAAKVPAELHIFEKGRHGVGLAASIPGTGDWPNRCRDWLRTRGLLENVARTASQNPNPK